jgi:virulence-associated protein VapD
VGSASKETNAPAQIDLAAVDIIMLTGKRGYTTILTILDVAGFPEVQGSLEVNMQVIASACCGM